MENEITRLNLVSPLYYVPVENPDPFARGETEYKSGAETLFCFELDENEGGSFEPKKEKLLGNLLFGGNAAGPVSRGAAERGKALFELPVGNYLFAQKREALGREEVTALAAEIQQEGLWRRLDQGKRLYLRLLFEDNSPVTQLWRPLEPDTRPSNRD